MSVYISRTWWVAAAVLTVGIVVACLFSGCATFRSPEWLAQERDLAADIEQAKIRLAELNEEAIAAHEAAHADPTPEKTAEADAKTKALQEKARATAKKIVDLEGLIEDRKAAEDAERESVKGATDIIGQYAPEPFRSIGLIALTTLLSFIKTRGYYSARESRSVADEREIGKSIVKSLDGKIPPEILATIKQGEKAEALVDEAQGRV